MNRHAIALLLSTFLVTGCGLLTPENIDHARKIAMIACIFGAPTLDQAAVFELCKIVASERAEAESILSGKTAARRAGASLCPSDAGVD